MDVHYYLFFKIQDLQEYYQSAQWMDSLLYRQTQHACQTVRTDPPQRQHVQLLVLNPQGRCLSATGELSVSIPPRPTTITAQRGDVRGRGRVSCTGRQYTKSIEDGEVRRGGTARSMLTEGKGGNNEWERVVRKSRKIWRRTWTDI